MKLEPAVKSGRVVRVGQVVKPGKSGAWRCQRRRRPPPTVRDILKRYWQAGLSVTDEYPREMQRHLRRVLARLVRCRTGELGSAQFRCRGCGTSRLVTVPCGNRHCAGCSFVRSNNWKADVMSWNVQCEYQHLVFTLPHRLNPWLRTHTRDLYNLLIRCVRDVLLKLHKKHFGCQPGALLTLHTWGQRMNQHVHVHVILTGGGLSEDGQRWVAVDHQSPQLSRASLAAEFKKVFLRRLRLLIKRWLAGSADNADMLAQTQQLLEALEAKTWMVNNQSPPPGKSGPEAVVNYLARYVAGVAISDSRIVGDDGTHVYFRRKDYQANIKTTEKVTGREFVRRFCLHILPSHFGRVRSIGLFRPQKRGPRLALVRHLIDGGTYEEFQALLADAEEDDPVAVHPLLRMIARLEEKKNEKPSKPKKRIDLTDAWDHDPLAVSGDLPPLTVEEDIQLAVRALLPRSARQTDVQDVPAVQGKPDAGRTNAPAESRKVSGRGTKLGPSAWRSQYTGCRRCGELMPKVEEYHESATKKLLQTAGRLIGLLSVLPWDVMVEVLQQLRSGQVSPDRWQGRLRKVTSEFKYFGPLQYNAVYGYTIEKIAEQLKSGELINPAIYVFNPDVVYDPQRKKKPIGRPTGIPPPRK
jgi:hypothetical protein